MDAANDYRSDKPVSVPLTLFTSKLPIQVIKLMYENSELVRYDNEKIIIPETFQFLYTSITILKINSILFPTSRNRRPCQNLVIHEHNGPLHIFHSADSFDRRLWEYFYRTPLNPCKIDISLPIPIFHDLAALYIHNHIDKAKLPPRPLLHLSNSV